MEPVREGRSGAACLRGADRCGPKRWMPICGIRSVVAEAVGADSSRVDMWNLNDCCLETEKKCSGMESDNRLSN